LQRKCGCGRHAHGGECHSCGGKREQALQRAPSHTAGVAAVPPIVREVLDTPGQPLDAVTRAFVEPRFGHDFSRVRVHTDARAAESARAVDALAYTVGRDIVFDRGQYAPATTSGRRLLVHELTHVLQQQFRKPAPSGSLSVASAGDALERDAEVVTDRVISGRVLPNKCFALARPSLQAQGTPDSTPEESTPKYVCGPDVTKQVSQALYDTMDAFSDWDDDDQKTACDAIIAVPLSRDMDNAAWDIVELHSQGWIKSFQRFDCSSEIGDPYGLSTCVASVQVGDQCYYAGSVNYIVFGLMCRMCHMFFAEMGDPIGWSNDSSDYTAGMMLNYIDLYKRVWPWIVGDVPSKNIQSAKDWAQSGYFGWPGWGIDTPGGDRPSCSPTCPRKALNKFHVYWKTRPMIPFN
jgi:hypothetical protein